MKILQSFLSALERWTKVYGRDNAYMICCPARSGSTLLVHLLRSHPYILSHGEVLGEKITGLSGPLGAQFVSNREIVETLEGVRRTDPRVYLYDYILNPHGYKAVGFKLKYEELSSPHYAQVLDLIRSDTDLKIIFLDRENLFERYVSHYVVMNVTGVTLIRSSDPKPKLRPITLQLAEIEQSFKDELKKREQFRALFSVHRSIETTYEKLSADTVAEMNRIYGFLGLTKHTASSTTKKILDTNLASFITNYDEILEHFSGTRYTYYFPENRGKSRLKLKIAALIRRISRKMSGHNSRSREKAPPSDD